MASKKARHTVVLLGVGHTNAHVLRMWKMDPILEANLICVSNYPIATYSGMMPGVLAGQYPVEAMEIDLVRLCRSAGARLVIGNVTGLDVENQKLIFADRPSIRFDQLSIGVGSIPTFEDVVIEEDNCLLAIKPMQTFLERLEAKLASFDSKQEVQISIVGGGIGTIETAFCLDRRLSDAGRSFRIRLISKASEIGNGLAPSTQSLIEKQLESRNIELTLGRAVIGIEKRSLRLETQKQIETDIAIWGTGAAAPDLLKILPLEKDDRGFIATKPTLQSLTSDAIYAVGDTGTIVDQPTDKAGVYAVRQGPILWRNIQNVLCDRKMAPYVPQREYLKLINTADGKSIAQRKGRGYYAPWCWWLKDRIDRKFMEMYQDYEPMPMDEMPVDEEEDLMRCLGCGGKIGGQILSSVLGELDIPKHDDVIIGLDQPDDAAVIRTTSEQVSVTTDFFASPLDDPYLTGRIAVLNSASDCFVMGAQPNAALAIVQLPMVHSRQQLQIMRELMTGSVEELARMGATIVGGHSIEGPRLLAGFTVMGNQVVDVRTKGQLSDGDVLVLSKPLGTGILLAAWMQCQLHGMHYQPLIDSMLMSNQIALKLAGQSDVSAITDVTGFGLAGHLKEMLVASDKSAILQLDQIPLLPGCQELIEQEIESTLAPDNRMIMDSIRFQGLDLMDRRAAGLFDPQTGGGLLFGVKESAADEAIRILGDEGFQHAVVIGQVTGADGGVSIKVEA